MDNIIKSVAVMEDIVNATATIDSWYYLFFAVNYDVVEICFDFMNQWFYKEK